MKRFKCKCTFFHNQFPAEVYFKDGAAVVEDYPFLRYSVLMRGDIIVQSNLLESDPNWCNITFDKGCSVHIEARPDEVLEAIREARNRA